MVVVQGRLTTASQRGYLGHRALLSLEELVLAADSNVEAMWAPRTLGTDVEADGTFELEIPDEPRRRGPFVLEVAAPDGESLEERAFEALPAMFTLQVDPKVPFTLQPNPRADEARRAKLTGRILDANGRKVDAGLQVVVWAAEPDADGAPAKVVFAAWTDRCGYFSADYPRGTYATAFATIGGGKHAVRAEVRLLGDGSFSRQLVLVADLDGIQHDEEDSTDCQSCKDVVPRAPDPEDLVNSPGCYSTDVGGGRCVDFTAPNRALEEFTFHTVVRTTEPEIRGSRPTGPRPIPPRALPAIAPLVDRLLASHEPDPDPSPTPTLARARQPIARALLASDVMERVTSEPDALNTTRLVEAERHALSRSIRDLVEASIVPVAGRAALTARNPVRWDADPDFYQSTSIAHGHVLFFKQVWRSDGYSLGDLLYSLPLAPCQKKQVAVLDWERREAASRTEDVEARESLVASLSRDRDIAEIIASTLAESSEGGSSAVTGGVGGAIGGFIGGLLFGAAGGAGGASSDAWQRSSRELAAKTAQHVRDRTLQSASALRGQRATVIQTAEQGETLRVETDVVHNHNHCHAITMQYFEVLRHLLVTQELSHVQECLFVPLLMSRFDAAKALRWREPLQRFLRDRTLRSAFAALDRLERSPADNNQPTTTYAAEVVTHLEGELTMSFVIERPADGPDRAFNLANWTPYAPLLWTGPSTVWNLFLGGHDDAQRERVFQRDIAPRIVEAFVRSMRFLYITTDGSAISVPADFSVVSQYREGARLRISVRPAGSLPQRRRDNISAVELRTTHVLPAHSKVVVWSAALRYRTAHLAHHLVSGAHVDNDLSASDPARIATPLDGVELANPRRDDMMRAEQLLRHLNEHLEHYHKAIWACMDPNRRYMLLDGFIAPNSGGRSVASVVENRLLGIVGNCLVMPVAPGYHLDPRFAQNTESPVDLFEHYAPVTPIPAMRISVPTRGVFAEAVMGSCNSCEEKDDTRFWRFEESPCGDEPTAIAPISTDSRRAEPPSLTPSALPAPIINLQNAPALPDPTGMAAALGAIMAASPFKDITGLEGNQRNALAAMQSSMDTAKAVASEVASLERQKIATQAAPSNVKNIEQALQKKLITPEQAGELTYDALKQAITGKTQDPAALSQQPAVQDVLASASDRGQDIAIKTPTGEQVEVRSPQNMLGAAPGVIWVGLGNNSPEARTFNPANSDDSGETFYSASVANMATMLGGPPGVLPTYHWVISDRDGASFDTPLDLKTKVFAEKPGIYEIEFTVTDPATSKTFSAKTNIGVPQFFVVIENDGTNGYALRDPAHSDPDRLFDTVLARYGLDAHKQDLLDRTKAVTESLLVGLNVRVVWALAPLNEAIPGHFVAPVVMGPPQGAHYSTIVIDGQPPQSPGPELLAATQQPAGPILHNEMIDVFPGTIERSYPEARAILTALTAATTTTERNRLRELWLDVVARIMGSTIAHEICHTLLGVAGGDTRQSMLLRAIDLVTADIDTSGHTRSGNDLMAELMFFGPATAITISDRANFPAAGSFTQDPISSILGLNASNKTRMQTDYPVPPIPPFDR